MPLAYLDTPSGISGDIFLGCLVDAGWPLADLRATVEALNLPAGSWRVCARTVMRGGLRATLVDVDVAEDNAQRHLADVQKIIEAAELPAGVKRRARGVFTRLAAAEAHIHDTTPDTVHFHEVGALDAVIDIVGVCAGLYALGIEPLCASALPLGPGWTDSMHGRLPLPAPATLELLAAVGASTVPAPGPGELVTPTGAALLAELAEFRRPAMRLHCIGYGAGQKVFDWPNVARLWLGEEITAPAMKRAGPRPAPSFHSDAETSRRTAKTEESSQENLRPYPVSDSLVIIETNIDDMNPELYEPVQQRLFAAGALDVWATAIAMKKGRPGTLLSVLASEADEGALARLLLRETTTLGVRVYPVRRHIAEREMATVETRYGAVRVKLKWVDGQTVGAKPEFEDCRRLAVATDTPLPLVYAAAQAAAFRIYEEQAVSDAEIRS